MDLLFFSNQQNVYKLKASDVADAKASALGDYLPNLLQLDAEETIIYMTATADYSGQMVFFFANGKAARVDLTAYKTTSNRRKLTGAYSDKAPLACIRRLDTDCELAVYSTEPRALIFHTALLAPKTTRTTQGVAVMTLKPKYQLETVKALEDTPITNQSRYRVRSLPAAGACCGRRTPRSGRWICWTESDRKE